MIKYIYSPDGKSKDETLLVLLQDVGDDLAADVDIQLEAGDPPEQLPDRMRVQEAGVQDGKAGQVPQADALAAPGVGAAGHQQHRVAVQQVADIPLPIAGMMGVADVEGSAQDPVDDLARMSQDQTERAAGQCVPKPVNLLRKTIEKSVDAADQQTPGVPSHRSDALEGALFQRQNSLRVADQFVSRRGGLHAPSEPREQRLPNLTLQLLHAPADRGLGDVEPARGPREAPRLDDVQKRPS